MDLQDKQLAIVSVVKAYSVQKQLGKDVSDLRVLIKARENETRLIADKRWEDLGVLKEGTTSLHYAELMMLANRTVVLESKEKTVEK